MLFHRQVSATTARLEIKIRMILITSVAACKIEPLSLSVPLLLVLMRSLGMPSYHTEYHQLLLHNAKFSA